MAEDDDPGQTKRKIPTIIIPGHRPGNPDRANLRSSFIIPAHEPGIVKEQGTQDVWTCLLVVWYVANATHPAGVFQTSIRSASVRKTLPVTGLLAPQAPCSILAAGHVSSFH